MCYRFSCLVVDDRQRLGGPPKEEHQVLLPSLQSLEKQLEADRFGAFSAVFSCFLTVLGLFSHGFEPFLRRVECASSPTSG